MSGYRWSLTEQLERVRSPLMLILGALIGAVGVYQVLERVPGTAAFGVCLALLGTAVWIGWNRKPVLRDRPPAKLRSRGRSA